MDSSFRRLSRGEQCPLYRNTEICLYADLKEGVQIYTLRPVKTPTISSISSANPSSKRSSIYLSKNDSIAGKEWMGGRKGSVQACKTKSITSDILPSLTNEEYVVMFCPICKRGDCSLELDDLRFFPQIRLYVVFFSIVLLLAITFDER